jgi:hypothetical protein
MSHRPTQPRIHAGCRRPHALDQSADDNPVGLREPRLQWSIDLQLNVSRVRPPHHAIGKRGLEHFGVVSKSDQQSALGVRAGKVVESGREGAPVLALES